MKKIAQIPSPPAALPKSEGSSVIAYRKTCKATGTGLSHYILMDKKAK
jgi:modified peptide precursor CbpA